MGRLAKHSVRLISITQELGDAFVEQEGVQLVVALEPQARCEEAFPHQTNLIFDLTFPQPHAGVQATGSMR
jgi:hypothetical protein